MSLSNNQANSSNRRTNRTSSNLSSSNTNLIDVPTSSNAASSNRPITRSFAKQQQQQQSISSTPQLQPSLSLSSLSSSNSSINSMDTTNINTQIDSKFSPVLSYDTNSYLFQLNQEKFKLDNKCFNLNEEKTYQKIITNENSMNVINFLENRKFISNNRFNFTNLPNNTLSFLTQRLKSHDYPLLIKKLDQSSITLNLVNGTQEVDDLVQVLRDIENRLINYNPLANDPENSGDDDNLMRDEFEVETINVESAFTFRQYGGIQILKRILLLSILVTDSNSSSSSSNNYSSSSSTCSSLITDTNLVNFSKLNNNNNNLNEINNNSIIKNNLINNNFNFNKNLKINNNNNNNYTYNKNNNKNNENGFEKCFILKIKCKLIHILNRLICLPHFGKLLVYDLLDYRPLLNNSKQQQQNQQTNCHTNNSDYDTTLLQYLFSLLMFKESRLQSCQLIESILLHIPMLNLSRIQNLKLILENIDEDGLSCICKIFAVTLSNLDMADKKYLSSGRRVQAQIQTNAQNPITTASPQILSYQAHSTSQKPTEPSTSTSAHNNQPQPLSVRDQNQEFLLNIPSLLFRLVNLVRRKDYTVRFNGANNEIEHWIRYIDEALSDSDSDDNESMDYSSNINLDSQLNQPALLAAAKLNNFVYVLYTLSLLLIGKEKKKVQKALTKLRLASALNSLFDHLIWNCRCEHPGSSQDQQQQQMRSHICPEVAVKIQFLRLVHSFCDHSEFKRVILSKEETDEILRYNFEAQECLKINESVLKIENRIRCTKESVGLLSKIVQVIKKEPFSASFRFWLIRAIESYLRGGTSYAEQLFLINRGIVEDTVQNILAVNFSRPKEVIQSCFDMLGELIKFNTKGFEILNNQLIENEKFNLLLTMINQSLIDSNMFLRSIFLSIDFIEANSNSLDYKISSNKVLAYFDLFERRILFLSRMMNIINIHNLSQENISCLNTTLIVLMIANRRNILPKYLRAIKSKSIEMLLTSDFINVNRETTSSSRARSNSTSQPIDLISNFKDLLLFWQTHYLQKDKDCAGLEQNSKIEFTYWKKTVDLLLDTNPANECSLNFYLNNDFRNNNRKTSIDDYRSD